MALELVTGYRGMLHITAPQDADLYRGLFGEGRVAVGNNMEVTLTAPLEVTVLDGVCLLDGREFFIANEDSVSVECQFDDGEAYLCICYEKDEYTKSETADLQILDEYNDQDIRNNPGESQKPLAKLTITDGSITDIEMLVDMAQPIIDTTKEANKALEEVNEAIETVREDTSNLEEVISDAKTSASQAYDAADNANNAAEVAEKVVGDALFGVNVNDVPQEIVDHVVNIVTPTEEEMEQAIESAESAQTMISDKFDENVSYSAGDYCIYDNTLYMFTIDHTGEWTGDDVEQTTVANELDYLTDSLDGKAPTSHASSDTTYGVGTTSNYGHCRTINNLTTSSHTNGYALSAYQGYVLNSNISGVSGLKIQTGHLGTTSLSASTYTDVSVTFSSSFSSTPNVVVQLAGNITSQNYGNVAIIVQTRSTTGFTIRFINSSTSSSIEPQAEWIAVGK